MPTPRGWRVGRRARREVSAPDLRTLKAHPEFLHHFDKLTGGNADRILEAAAENAEQKGYGKRRRDKDARG